MEPVRILQVFTIMNRGGAESMIMNYYRNINRQKIQFDFLVHRNEKAVFDDEIRELGGEIYKISPINPLRPISYYNELRTFFKLNTHYKIVHSHLNTFSGFPLKIAEEFKIPIRIAHAHIAIDKLTISKFLFGKESLKENFKKLIKYRLKKNVKTYATHYFSCGKKAGKWLFGANTQFTLMNNAIEADKFVFSLKREESVLEELELKNKFIIGHVGRFNDQKNHLFLLNIFQEIVKINPNAYLVLIGNGYLQEAIKERALKMNLANKIKFLGERSDVFQLMSSFNAFVFPSFYEGLPVTLIEAQASGVKVYASDAITKEVSLTNLVEFLSIKENPSIWAKTIIENTPKFKENTLQKIKSGGYDIVENCKKIESFYLSQYINIK